MKKIFCIFLMLFSFVYCFSAENQDINKNTALRYLKLSQDYVLKSDWNSLLSTVEIGLTYDSSIADLWYVKALGLSQLKKEPYLIVNCLEKSLERKWYSYNENNAKILLSNFYYHTLEYEKALNLLSNRGLTLNSEALKTKAKIYYITGEIAKARETIDVAWRMFPTDADFPIIFFTFEKSNDEVLENTENLSSISNQLFYELRDTFLSLVYDYTSVRNRINQDVLLLASSFAVPKEQVKFLKVYKTQGIDNPLYAIKALEADILTEEEAVKLFFELSAKNINYNHLESFISLLSEDMELKVFSILDSYEGNILFDYNQDGIFELVAFYKNGRPDSAQYEATQNGFLSWISTFDYGTPRKVYIPKENIQLYYARYPYISKIEIEKLDYNLIPDSVKWLPFNVVEANFSTSQYAFYIPEPNSDLFVLDKDIYKDSVSVVTYLNKKGQVGEEKIRFLLSEGKPVSGNYYIDNCIYASSIFENGQLMFRNVDKDFNGSFEITEIYSVLNKDGLDTEVSVEESTIPVVSNVNMLELFGDFDYQGDLWLSSVSVDLDENGFSDYKEEYDISGNITKYWNEVIEKRNGFGNLITVTYKNPLNDYDVEVYFEDNLPIYFLYNNSVYPINFQENTKVYWIGDIPDYSKDLNFNEIKNTLNEKDTVYAVNIYTVNDNTFYILKTFDMYFAQDL